MVPASHLSVVKLKWDIIHGLLLGAWHIVSIQEILIFVIAEAAVIAKSREFLRTYVLFITYVYLISKRIFSGILLCVLHIFCKDKKGVHDIAFYWVGQKIHSGFYTPS